MRVLVAGSRSLPSGTAPRALLTFLARLPPECPVLLRAPVSGHSGRFEEDVEAVCRILSVPVEWRRPNLAETHGRASVYARDIGMVEDADLVVLFLDGRDAEEGYSGTYHLYERALEADRPLYVWRVDTGVYTRWGEHDPDHLYASMFS